MREKRANNTLGPESRDALLEWFHNCLVRNHTFQSGIDAREIDAIMPD
jgi:hypothetical protein